MLMVKVAKHLSPVAILRINIIMVVIDGENDY